MRTLSSSVGTFLGSEDVLRLRRWQENRFFVRSTDEPAREDQGCALLESTTPFDAGGCVAEARFR